MHINFFNAFVFLSLWGLLILGFGFFSQYDQTLVGDYSRFIDVNLITFVGVALFASVLSESKFITSGQALLAAVFASVWALFNNWIWRAIIGGPGQGNMWLRYSIGIDSITMANFTAVAVLVSLIVMADRLSITQTIIIAIAEVIFATINTMILHYRFGVADNGATMTVWAFGAFFGLALASAFDTSSAERLAKVAAAALTGSADSTSRTTSMIGTLLLFALFPSWNLYFAGAGATFSNRIVTNTYLALAGSVVGAIFGSALFKNGDVEFAHIQRAVLAGGIATGTTAPMLSQPWGALIIGTFVGIVAVFSEVRLQKFVTVAIRTVDAVNVFSYVAVPAVWGVLASVILSANADSASYVAEGTSLNQIWSLQAQRALTYRSLLGYQFASIGTTIGIAIFGGAVTARVLRFTKDSLGASVEPVA